MMLNEFCANELHIRKATVKHTIRVASMKLEIPLCPECYQMLASGKFV